MLHSRLSDGDAAALMCRKGAHRHCNRYTVGYARLTIASLLTLRRGYADGKQKHGKKGTGGGNYWKACRASSVRAQNGHVKMRASCVIKDKPRMEESH